MKIDDVVYRALFGLAWLLTHCTCRLQVSGREHIPRQGSLLVVVNHLSWYDPFLIGILFPRRLWFYTKTEIFSWPLIGWLARMTGQIPVERGAADRLALERALAYLREGKALVIFPEGTVEREEQMIPAHTGVAMIALRSRATLLPVAHTGTRRLFRRGGGWLPRVSVRIGEAYLPVLPEGVPRKIGLQVVTDDIMKHIADMMPDKARGVYRG